TFMKENRASEKIMSETSMLLGRIGHPPKPEAFNENSPALGALIDRLSEIDTHYTRKENQLFPMLEAHHFTGPSQVMWSIHDDIRAGLKQAREALAKSDPEGAIAPLKEAIQAIRDMIYKEEHILYPASLDMLSDQEWFKVKEGETDIGFAWVVPDTGWPEDIIQEAEGAPPEPEAVVEDVAGALGLDTGRMTLEQINLMLTHLPVDLTFVDENDRVAYYSEGPERIFPRSPAIIGREVRNCHPPKSVHLVNQILDAFKSGSRDTAEFWIELGGKFIYIRYFAVRDAGGYYKGCLEVSQDLTRIRKLEGQNRLLDWE
ncbi:MAG: PAS domain-containing protein, partial [Desulfobacterales bacterium]